MYLIAGAVVALLVLAGAVYQMVGTHLGAQRYGPPGAVIDVDGQSLHVVCAGRGQPPVVFESGIAASSLSWALVQSAIAGLTRACAYDRAGLGWSAASRGPRTVDRMLHELQGVLANAGSGKPVILVGHSFGAFLACAYASRRPMDIAGLVLLDPPSEWHDPTRRQQRLLWGGIQLSRLGGVLAGFGVVRASLALLTGGAQGRLAISRASSDRPRRRRSSGSSVKHGNCPRRCTRSCRRCGASQNVFERWPTISRRSTIWRSWSAGSGRCPISRWRSFRVTNNLLPYSRSTVFSRNSRRRGATWSQPAAATGSRSTIPTW